jgi:hypothetical protein
MGSFKLKQNKAFVSRSAYGNAHGNEYDNLPMRISMRSCVDAATLALCGNSSQWRWDSDSCGTRSSTPPYLSDTAPASVALLAA